MVLVPFCAFLASLFECLPCFILFCQALNLHGWPWLRISPEVLSKASAGATSSEGLSGVGGAISKMAPHMALGLSSSPCGPLCRL